MDYKVLKAFNTANRRLTPGEGPGGKMSDEDVFEPFTLADLRDRKFLEEITPEPQAALVDTAATKEKQAKSAPQISAEITDETKK